MRKIKSVIHLPRQDYGISDRNELEWGTEWEII